ncbi:hypothetical protein [Maricaulis maris]|uniref:Uncharacterized protein n=1 Tax=Maricaulis maris TaxID=74318 RepID=A0A495DM18_9PROT|nr:hypothetical protein [Maricaulis maris]RKR03973.1 hypothetical protein C7435_0416 [Maricaulis maris]
MRKFLLAGAALAVTGAAAFALDDDDARQMRVHVSTDHHATFVGDDGQIVEIRGANGDRTIHIDRDGERSVIRIDGQEIEIDDNIVHVDGNRVEVGPRSVIIIDGDDVRVVEDEHVRMGRELDIHMAERAEHLADMEHNLARIAIDLDGFDGESLEATVMHSLEMALAGLDEDRVVSSRDWEELSDEEKAEVRAELREARQEMREAMEEARRELREAGIEMEAERRHARIEVERAVRDMARAERDIARARVEVLRADDEMRRARVEVLRADDSRRADIERLHQVMGRDDVNDIRIEETDGRQRVWIDGEEQTGDDLVDWLNRLEVDRLAGADREGRRESRDARRQMRIERVQRADNRRVIELDGGDRVVIMEIETGEDDEE